MLYDVALSRDAALCELEETTLGGDLSLGWGLQGLVSLIKTLAEDEKIRQWYLISIIFLLIILLHKFLVDFIESQKP